MKKTIQDFNLKGKKVIIRCDFNVPITNNKITDYTRIIRSLKTIQYALTKGAKVILLSHLGNVKEESDKKVNSLYPVSKALSKYLNKEVKFSSSTSGSNLNRMVEELKDGDILLIQNTRFEDLNGKRESNCDDELSKYWASLGDIFINDAYGSSHRNHASVTGIPKYLPSGIGFLVEEEIKKIDRVLKSNNHPFVVVMGGKKVEDKLGLINVLAQKCDKLLVGGAMSFTFLKALGYNIGSSIVSDNHIDYCKDLLNKYGDKIILPKDYIVENEHELGNKKIEEFNDDDIGYDIGYMTVKLFSKELTRAKRVIFNGPMGMFEDPKFSIGTYKVLETLKNSKAKTVIGGGDTASSANKLGFNNKDFYHISTGGGATMKYLEEEKLIGIEVIDDEERKS